MARGKGSVNAHTRPQETIAAVPTNRSVCMVQIFFSTTTSGSETRAEEKQLIIEYVDDDGVTDREEHTGETEISTARSDLQTNYGIRLDYPV